MAGANDTFALEGLVQEAALKLAEWKVPVRVAFGRHRLERELVTRDEVRFLEGEDDYAPSAQAGGNTPPMALRLVGGVAEIAGRSTKTGATVIDHRRVVNSYVHSVVAAILWAGRQHKIEPEILGGEFVDEDKEAEYGAKYELRFRLAETIFAAPFTLRAPPTTYTGSGVLVLEGVEVPAC